MTLTDKFAARAERMKASETRELLKLIDKPEIISFAGGIPDPALFPAEAFKAATEAAMAKGALEQNLQYSTTEGLPALRSWIAAHMQSLGIPAEPRNILITAGSQQALDYIGKLFVSAGEGVMLGKPTYHGALTAFNPYEPRFITLDLKGNRAIERAREAAEGAPVKLAYVTPDFANPTGVTLSRAERLTVLEQAEALGAAVVEDAAYQALRYHGESIPPVLALEVAQKGSLEDCRTLYCGSFSKTLAPGLRIGWVCAAHEVIDKLVLVKQAGDLHVATLNQAITAEVASAVMDSHVPKLRAAYGARLDAMLEALETHMPSSVSWTRPEGGMFVWLSLPEGSDSRDLLARALENNVAFVPGTAFHADGSGAETFRLNFSMPSAEMINEGVKRLAALLK